ncbi:hypothetical protein [Bradyrhizobium liaoningense]|uniref:hypothetical protein n=1 Tax=Bradyrhizobium liaoningense TaxID=43992 RepID=UPI001BA91C95|nr:hypothetical protein [Bradyrhizobium liaoningense]MBR1167495.1 hypothetical protein [Bradyrhizobium liaoningense]
MTAMLAAQSAEARAKGEALIRTADKLLCESWNERMWSAGDRTLAIRLIGTGGRTSPSSDEHLQFGSQSGAIRDCYSKKLYHL